MTQEVREVREVSEVREISEILRGISTPGRQVPPLGGENIFADEV